ncbi:glycine cleavage system H protein (lipoate-binding) [Desulfosporosinus orientis DSM 765]|uniref:Glycine cleavage system H protein (Lipoate-binding) n=1 Tax=Desulfosporosinus orientis (strain ATCC 19365 / DSM 765 / NCIMB 8382 / VKM B-1628 / Singapore I) TaxID=768706 RepID=G7WJ98_DESOD|nr:glycine cleavage system protein H [Desulfosporosinus orientis]AET69757.1 glycine cleavage system H protein (lipoate-binding) [Desulfosporosinus orientis DSM 765]
MAIIEGYNLPDDLYYTEDHAWVKVEGNLVRVGMNDFAQKLAGDISFVKLPKVGKEVAIGKLLSSMQSGKWAGRIEVPVTGKIVEVNKVLLHEPQKMNHDCYGTGWIALIEPSNFQEDSSKLMDGAQAAVWLKGEIARNVPGKEG